MVGAAITTVLLIHGSPGHQPVGFSLQIALWLWFTVLFANFAEAVAEGRGKAQAEALRKATRETMANRFRADGTTEAVSSSQLRKGDVVVVEAGEIIPGDGEVIEGAATVDESAITGESAPVIREAGGDRSAVTGGTRVLSDEIKIRITANPGERFPRPHDFAGRRRAAARRRRTKSRSRFCSPALTVIFLLVVVTLKPFGIYSAPHSPIAVLIALLVCLIPDDHRRLAERHRHRRHGPPAAAQRAGHERPRGRGRRRRGRAAARQDRHHHARQPPGHRVPPRARRVSTSASPTPRNSPRSPTKRPKAAASSCWPRKNSASAAATSAACTAEFVPFTAQTRMSGVDPAHGTRRSAKARPTPSRAVVEAQGGNLSPASVTEQRRGDLALRRHAARRRRKRAPCSA